MKQVIPETTTETIEGNYPHRLSQFNFLEDLPQHGITNVTRRVMALLFIDHPKTVKKGSQKLLFLYMGDL